MKHRLARRPLPLLAAALLVVLAAGTARAQGTPRNFAVGGGGSLVNDLDSISSVKNFSTAGWHLFGELNLDRWGTLQARYSHFGLPGTAEGAPNLGVDAATLTVSYVFQEEWWRAGFYAGPGAYWVKPNALEPGQVPADSKESVFGLTGGVLCVFDVTRQVDLRLELSAHLIYTEVRHTPMFLSAGVAYHF